jgi:hypothetical protein
VQREEKSFLFGALAHAACFVMLRDALDTQTPFVVCVVLQLLRKTKNSSSLNSLKIIEIAHARFKIIFLKALVEVY